jgi:hypothetical protein
MIHVLAIITAKPGHRDGGLGAPALRDSQEAFAWRYCLDAATVRNWEQGRTIPEGPAATLWQLIDRDPDKIVELLAS